MKQLPLVKSNDHTAIECKVKVDQVFISGKPCANILLPEKFCLNRIRISRSFYPLRNSKCTPNNYSVTVKERKTTSIERSIFLKQGYAEWYGNKFTIVKKTDICLVF